MRWLRALYVSNGLAIGALYGFVPVLLQSRGFEPALIGLTTGLGSLAYAIALPAWGHMGDIVSGPRRTLQLACIPAAIFAIGLSAPIPAVAIIFCQLVISAGGGPTLALTDAMAVPTLANASREYARLRLLTSIGAASAAIGCGFLYARTGYLAAPFVYFITMAVTVICVMFVPLGRDSERRRMARRAAEGRVQVAPERGRFGSVGEALTVQPRLVDVLVSVTLVFLGVMAAATYISIRISDLGGGAAEVGLSNGIGSAAEVPGMILAGWLVGRIGTRLVLPVAAIGFAACMLSWIVLVDEGPIMVTRFASGIFFAGIFVSFVLTMARMLPARLQATGQTLFQAACFGVAAIVANVVGGVLYAAAGPLGVFGAGAVCTVAGGLVGLVVLPGVAVTTDAGAGSALPASAPAS
jgi:PPP family 3-phenylpropionic acid transporter